ncbi:hypothetical protein F4679DRAFT_562993 [Xylaria curta]|nr:hypothetical protein F4679DRAFT_562993 [Xylaria curta]
MADVTGLVFGAVGILTSLKGTLDTALLIECYFDNEKLNCNYLALCYHIQKTRLDLWRQAYKIDDVSACPLRIQSVEVQNLILQILGQITQLLDESTKLAERHDIRTPSLSSALQAHDAVIKALSKQRVTPKAKFLWTIKGKVEFEEKVLRIATLVDSLQSFTLNASESQSLDRALPSMSLKHITTDNMLQALQAPETKVGAALSLSAKAKELQNNLARLSNNCNSTTVIDSDRLNFLRNSPNIAILRSTTSYTSVWVEWGIISEGAAGDEYICRIKALGYLLKELGGPTLRLPICHGIFDDLAYQATTGVRRIGYVFGAPLHSTPRYESDFRDHPPRTLSNLIQTRSFPVPLLGDRFTLAFTLATAFCNFHSAGWLHKGFHSENVVFLAQTSSQDEAVIKVTDPFITGFQYSRPTNSKSLSRGPLENCELEYYYHPSADQGFSRRIDLYSLGVVLCEIGRWGLVGNSVSRETQQKMVNREAWRKYLIKKMLPEMGWRMGEKYQCAVRTLLECRLPDDDEDYDSNGGFFEQQYFERVIQPLSLCSA